ncbi:MAG TPA: iron-sulfur cluster-binding protein [Candidatus Wujingus californicus]|uniref:iron-sulfur cluster-binding protein n=1 Tax=Candidatus Wujingus californicus TaxID=3367618 RepID=UPI001D981F8A|nr:hypothetical protein [Planctomycetota bacterium]MDO8094851.1 hypothetical protein [Candidatus Brocadiales bacterium]MDO8131128.1 hypothetical protein [Candidatus Brocadiales bacterium]
MESLAKITRIIARSHMYWGRKPISDLVNIFEEIKDGDIVLDPFCGGGNPAIAALMKGGRVIAGDLNPMAVFLTKVLIRPINLATLKSAFEDVAGTASRNILEKYKIKCPDCKQMAVIKYLVWANKNINESNPETAQIECRQCGKLYRKLSSVEVRRQLELSQMSPRFWFPKNRIHSTRKPPVEHHYELFTGRNLSMLAELLHAIKQVSSQNTRDALFYIFTAMLYSCSSMQMFSEKERSSSRGWTALRFYIPPKRKEMNVWHAFEGRFANFMKCKEELSRYLPSVRITDSVGVFSSKNYEALLFKTDAFDLISQVGKKANLVFLDPPYIDDIDYFGFSEFLGAWLQMHFDFDKEWHPRRTKAELLKKLLMLLNEVPSESCEICLAFAPKHQKGWNEDDCIKESKYYIKRTGFFNYDNSNKRGVINNKSHRFTILERKKSKKSVITEVDVDNIQRPLHYLRVIDYLYPRDRRSHTRPRGEKTFYDKPRSLAILLAPDILSQFLKNLKEEDIEKAISNKTANEKTYHSLCYSLLRIILSEDNCKITYIDPAQFEDNVFGMVHQEVSRVKPAEVPNGIAFVAQNDNKKILFCFDDQEAAFLKRVSGEVKNFDNGEFKNICVMIVRSMERIQTHRQVVKADEWPRGFFMCFPEIQRKSEKINEKEYLKLCARTPRSDPPKRSKIMSVTAKVSDNIPVGNESPNHYKLRFKTPKGFNIIPGQFIMMATDPQRHDTVASPMSWDNLKSSFKIEPTSYLKRPFGIHRAFYPHFDTDYLQKLSLPPALATVLHTVFPNKFEIFYKVLTNGVGTKELTRLRKGDKIQIIGPLGNSLNMRDIRDKGFEEIHVIGGGVGMAPLIFMVQALRYYSYKVKAFIGTEKIGTLKYKHDSDGLGATFSEEPRDATLYIDDLKDIGINQADIYVSSTTTEDIKQMITKKNFYNGFVSAQYNDYLQRTRPKKKILAFSCGPVGMMKALALITTEYEIQLKVLIEKRMACGIGVCLSCVCETKTGEGNYSRVCTDGPIFDASEILW